MIVDRRSDYGVAADFKYRRGQKQDYRGNALQRVGHVLNSTPEGGLSGSVCHAAPSTSARKEICAVAMSEVRKRTTGHEFGGNAE